MCHYGIEINDNPYESSKTLGIYVNEELLIRLRTKGTKIRFETRVSTTSKMDMTSSVPWGPSRVTMVETNRPDDKISPVVCYHPINGYQYIESTSDESQWHEINPCLTCLRERTIFNVNVSLLPMNDNTMDLVLRRTFVSSDRHTTVTVETISEKIMIGHMRATATLTLS